MYKFAAFALAAATVFAAPASATGLEASQTIERMVVTEAEDGTSVVSYETAETVVPGDELVYSIAYANESTENAENVVLTMPVPTEVSYIEGSATKENVAVAFSADGGQTFSQRGDLTVSVDGEKREALSEEITHIRWTVTTAIEPGTEGQLIYRAVLN